MHRTLAALAMAAFVAEEIFHQRRHRKKALPEAPVEAAAERHSLDVFDILRLLELLLLTLILSTVGGRPGEPVGQLSMILVGLQISRLFGRKILSRWSVLGILQALEIILLLILMLIPFNPHPPDTPSEPAAVLALVSGIAYGILITLCAAFSAAYWIKLYSREFSKVYETFPPLADSEAWASRFATLSLWAGLAASTAMFVEYGATTLPLHFTVSVILTGAGVLRARRENYKGHHRLAHLFWSLSFLLTISLFIAGVTAPGTG